MDGKATVKDANGCSIPICTHIPYGDPCSTPLFKSTPLTPKQMKYYKQRTELPSRVVEHTSVNADGLGTTTKAHVIEPLAHGCMLSLRSFTQTWAARLTQNELIAKLETDWQRAQADEREKDVMLDVWGPPS